MYNLYEVHQCDCGYAEEFLSSIVAKSDEDVIEFIKNARLVGKFTWRKVM